MISIKQAILHEMACYCVPNLFNFDHQQLKETWQLPNMMAPIFSKQVIFVGFLLPMVIVLSGKIGDKARTTETGWLSSATTQPLAGTARFRALVLAENGGHHIEYSKVARPWLDKLAADSNFLIDHIISTDSINDEYLKRYQLFIQLDYPPYGWKDKAVKAFEKYITEGKGGWIGFHHATLLGKFDGYPVWEWFFHFMGGIKFKDYIAGFAAGNVKVEDLSHPVVNGIPSTFHIKKEEWYTYDKSPREKVHVIASVDESSYSPASDKNMGDHPVVWTNKNYAARNVYIFMGHSPELLDDENYKQLFRNAIFWAAGK